MPWMRDDYPWISGGEPPPDEGLWARRSFPPPDNGPGPYGKVAIFLLGMTCVLLVVYVTVVLWR